MRTWQKWALFLLSIPISFLANVGRVTLMVIVGYQWGVAEVEKWYFHDLFGFVLFIVAFVCLFAVESLMLTGAVASDRKKKPRPRRSPGAAAAPAAAGRAEARRRSPVRHGRRRRAFDLRRLATPGDPGLGHPQRHPEVRRRLDRHDQPLAARLRNPRHQDVLARSYVNSKGDRVSFLIVLAQQSPSRTHPPEQCLSGEGYTIVGASDRDLVLGSRSLPSADRAFPQSGPAPLLAFLQERRPSQHELLGASDRHRPAQVEGSLAADVLIRAETDADPNDPARGARVLTDFYGAVAPYLLSKLP